MNMMPYLGLGGGASAATPRRRAYVVPQTGQSNEQGGELSPTNDLPPEYRGEQAGIYIWDDGNYIDGQMLPGTFVPMIPNHNTAGEWEANGHDPSESICWGPEQSLLQDLKARLTDGDIFSIKVTHGGLSLDSWKPGGYIRERLDIFIPAAMQWLEDNDYEIVPVVYLFGQGEAGGANYVSGLTEFITHSRGLTSHFANIPFLIRKLSPQQTFLDAGSIATINGYYETIRDTVANVVLVDPEDTTVAVYPDLHIHYTTASLLNIGHLGFETLDTNGLIP